ncbi:MAG: murein biosynthesis integral membrane protein MurJ [Patescibacteria group bacterium]
MKLFNKSTIFTSAFILAVATLVSKILGLLRDRIFAIQFGAGDTLDVYFTAFRLPDLIFNLLILGALSSAFVPVFVGYISANQKDKAWYVTNSLLNIFFVATLVFCALLFIFMEYFVNLIAPGFSESKRELTVTMSRIMLLSPIFFCLSNVAASILNSFKSFFLYALAPIMYNLGIIFGAIFFVPRWGIYGLAFGVVLGAFLNMAVQVPKLFILGFRWKPIFDFRHEGVKKIWKLMIPRTMSLALDQINLLVITVLASFIIAGSVAIFNFANNLQSFPVSIFGVAYAIAAFPYLAEAVSKNDILLFRTHFSKTFSQILFFIIPISCLIILLRAQIVRLVLGAGKFDWEDTYLTAQSLGLFSLAIFAQALIHLLARTFYSLSDTKTPFFTSIFGIITNIILGIILIKIFGVLGLVFSYSFASFLNMILLLSILRLRVGDLGDFHLIKNIMKILLISLVMSLAVYGTLHLIASKVDMQTFLGILKQTAAAGFIGVLIFVILSLLLKCDEARSAIGYLKNRFGSRRL